MRKRSARFEFTRRICRWSAVAICSAAMSMSSLDAADIAVNTVNDTGPGSLRQGASGANSGDILLFNSILNGTTLANGSTIQLPTAVTFQDATSITLIDNHPFQLASPITVPPVPPSTTSTTSPAPLTVNWSGTLTLNGILSDTTTGGNLIKTGLGTLVLSNANTYSGGTTINGGTLSVLNSSALGTGALTAANTVGTPVLSLGNGLNLANAITLQTALTLNTTAGTSNQLGGVISGTAATDSLNTVGTGTLIFSGTNTFAGGVHVTNASTISLLSSAGLGTGTLTAAGALDLNLAGGLSVTNKISLANGLTTNVNSGTATLGGAITETVSSQLTKTGAGTLILSGTNNYTGGTVVSQGTLQGDSNSLTGNITNNSSLIFNQSGTGTYSGTLSGTGNLTKTGNGTLIFGGISNLTSATNVNTGELQVTGTMSGPVNVTGATALLSGTGTVGSVTNSGFVQPGSTSIGTLHVNGNYTQLAGGTTEIKVNSAGNVPGVNNDNLSVTGQAKLNGTLQIVTTGGGTFTAGTPYTILNATGGVSGTFAQASTNLSMFGVDVTYGTNAVTFQLQQTTSLHAAATTANQANVGAALDNIALTSTGGLFTMINTLGIQPAAQQRQSLNQLSGEMFGNVQTLGLQMGDQFQQRVTSALVSNGMFLVGRQSGQQGNEEVRGQSLADGSSRGWMQGYGVGGNIRSDGNGAGMNYSQGGGLYGVDLGDDETGRVGVAGGNSNVGFSDGFGGNGSVTGYQVGMYLLKHDDMRYILGTANYGYNIYVTNRNVSVAGVSQSLHSDFTGNQIGMNMETGLKLNAGMFHVQPLVGLQYLYLRQQGLEESGGSASLSVGSGRANSLRANIGARVVANQIVGHRGVIWTPYTHARFVSDLLDNDRIINASFNGATVGGAFTSQGTRIGQNYGVIGEGVQIKFDEQLSLFGGADVMTGNRITVATGSIALMYQW